MRYEGDMYRPPSEARSYILQATIGCSHNLCTYCRMYRGKAFRIRPVDDLLWDIREAGLRYGPHVEKVFIADGDPLIMPLTHWEPILEALNETFPRLRRVSCYAIAANVIEKDEAALKRLRELGLSLLYVGPESGDPKTLKRIVKGATFEDHVVAAEKARAAGMALSVIFLLGAGGVARSEAHAEGSAKLATAMDPRYLSALTLTVVPGTPIARAQEKDLFKLPDVVGLLKELRTMVDLARPTDTLFRTNHASNYLPIGGRLPRDRTQILSVIDRALSGGITLRPEWARGL